jgi:nucleoside-diphosphate-sugar epimerase
MRIFISGVAGFLGSHLADAFLADGQVVLGVDFNGDHEKMPWSRGESALSSKRNSTIPETHDLISKWRCNPYSALAADWSWWPSG